MEANNEYEDYKKKMYHFPCAFNLIDADKVTRAKLRSVQHNLDSELDINDGDEDERIIKLNLLTWVRFRLEKHDEALQLSNDVVDLTKRRNVASLGNRVFVTLQTGDEVEAIKCLKDLEKLKSENDFHILYTDAQAEQAYYYSRLGGPNNLRRAIDIFLTLPGTPINYERIYGLGLVYRRATNANIYCSSLERLHVEEYEKKAAAWLFQVAENADNRLRSLAYGQLTTLRRSYPFREKLKLFRGLSVEELCERALQHDQNIPSVLTQCGKAMKPINIDKAIQWLSKSVAIRENSAAYHHLGICYKRKADQAARKRYHQTRSEESHGRNEMGQVRTVSQFSDQSNHVSRSFRDQQQPRTSGSTLSHQVNKESVPVRKDDPMADYGSKIASKRDAVVNNVPQHMDGRYGLPYYQTLHSPNRWQNETYQTMPSPNRWQNETYQTMPSPNRRQNETYQTMPSPNRWQSETYQTMPSPNRWQNETYQTMPSPNRRQNETYQTMPSPNTWQNETYQTMPSPNTWQNETYQTMPSEGSWKPEVSLKGSVKRCRNTLSLSKDDENVQEALKCFKKAIELSEMNLPAVLDLGLLLKQTNQINDALKQFNSITINYNHSVTHRATVISAYEQAGLCYLQLSETETNNDYREMAKQKLTKAVSIAADLVRVMPELQCSHKKVWVAFTTLLTEIDKEQISDDHRLIQKFKILELAREYWDVIDIIQKLRQTEHEDLTKPDVIKAALCSYLELGQPDNALGYHNLVAMNPAVRDSGWWDDETMRPLRIKVLLHATLARLRQINDSPTILFQQLFDLVFGSCIGVCDLENDQQSDTTSAVSGDVLFVFEANESPDEETTCPTVKSARCLKRVTTLLFGLQTEENSKGTGEFGGDRCEIQLKEMLKYQVVIIVLGDEERDRYFNAMLERVPCNKSKQGPTKQNILVIDAGLPDGDIPRCLKPFRSLKLADLKNLGDPQTAPESWDDTERVSFTDIINRVFDGNVEAIMKLFCFMIDQTWPCP